MALTLTSDERAELQRRVRSLKIRAEDARRARVILMLADGDSYSTIESAIPCYRDYINRWRRRFLADRLEGLRARYRGGSPTILTPKMEARVLQELALKRNERVLEVGTGSGYFTALLASCAGDVRSVEIDPSLAAAARVKLARADFDNFLIFEGDGARGYGKETYDAIVLTGSTPLLPERFFAQLKPGGRVFVVIGDAPAMTARLTTWTAPGSRVSRDLFETVIKPLRNAATPTRFEF